MLRQNIEEVIKMSNVQHIINGNCKKVSAEFMPKAALNELNLIKEDFNLKMKSKSPKEICGD
jgi:hypothetical protein